MSDEIRYRNVYIVTWNEGEEIYLGDGEVEYTFNKRILGVHLNHKSALREVEIHDKSNFWGSNAEIETYLVVDEDDEPEEETPNAPT